MREGIPQEVEILLEKCVNSRNEKATNKPKQQSVSNNSTIQIIQTDAETNNDTRHLINNNNNLPVNSTKAPSYLEELPEAHKKMMTGDWFLLGVPGNGASLTNSVAAFWFEDPRKGPQLRKMTNQFMLSTWWFWEPMLVSP